ncbi:hypothetical protein RD792_008636 [Penstemon davidsonii]|uniref:WRKY domain-containing protein n=1 Tax=Penstemon davidsonii TaxID=160366 RepID=A0ABR0D9T2_9LAMI|nr:hypothetical protein RD792_008636 [Penstemon davidsonii]
MFNFNSTMNSISQFENYPNPNPNPNFDNEVSYNSTNDNPPPCFDFLDYIMSIDEGSESEEYISLQNKDVQESVANCIDGSLDSADDFPLNIKCTRAVKKYKTQMEFKYAFRTKSNLDFMDDGFKWRKYGKKMIKSSPNPRNYFKCSSGGCSVKKRVERDGEDPTYVITTYEGVHNHESPT